LKDGNGGRAEREEEANASGISACYGGGGAVRTGEWAKSAEAAARLQKDLSRNQDGTFTAATLAAAIVKQCEDVVKRHEAAAFWEEYVNDGTFRALVSEMLDAKAWAKEKKELWMFDMSREYLLLARRIFSARLPSALAGISETTNRPCDLWII